MLILSRWYLHICEETVDTRKYCSIRTYEGWNFNSGNYLFTTGTK